MNNIENFKLALGSIRANLLRSMLTLMIIAVGITCLVGILTAIDSILFSMSNNFNKLGANSFNIKPLSETLNVTDKGKKKKNADPVNFNQAMSFKETYSYSTSKVSVDAFGSNNAEIKYASYKTNPNVRVVGIDENYINTSSYELESGRNFTASEVMSTGNKVILGSEIVDMLFSKKAEKAIGRIVIINSNRFLVVGTLKSKGSSTGGSNDRRVFITLYNAKTLYGYSDKNYNVTVSVANSSDLDNAISHAIGVMRNVRKLKIADTNDFEIQKSDGILNQLKSMTTSLRWGTIIIALLTLLGASIGLMNIMLVSVTERTREIGIRKALGATRRNIRFQFLIEAIIICLIGGIAGIFLGILMGFGVSLLVGGQFLIPWNWMALGFTMCIVVGLISGLIPAIKASRLDPIEALRYE
ncbi:MAG TPA: ABC transporter permease [Saprospiraceae bacterium]|jgi:putative ABC transport system permease protein|nr:ABC transporter permease [Saprospiraceae bacterium]HRO08255.1 ABC transporter permease [Saprospiraceae bacterium]HRP41146.1 ABC transporter permease [Saprospiraceae bacterium]